MILQKYDFDVIHCSGQDNIVANFFSRNPSGKFEDKESNTLTIHELILDSSNNCSPVTVSAIVLDLNLKKKFKNIQALRDQDESVRRIRD